MICAVSVDSMKRAVILYLVKVSSEEDAGLFLR